MCIPYAKLSEPFVDSVVTNVLEDFDIMALSEKLGVRNVGPMLAS